MAELRDKRYENVDLDTSRPTYFVDFQKIQVTPYPVIQEQDFKTLGIDERQELLEKLIKRVKKL